MSWEHIPGGAKDIGVASRNLAWHIGVGAVPGGYNIWRWNGSGWVNVPGGAHHIDVGDDGTAWVVNANGVIFRYNGSAWPSVPGWASDIGVGGGTNISEGLSLGLAQLSERRGGNRAARVLLLSDGQANA